MEKTIEVGLSGHAERYRLNEDAYDRLKDYFDAAEARLQDDADRTEVLSDLERSVGDKLAALLASGARVVMAADIDGVLEEIGAVDTGREPAADAGEERPRPRRLRRIREGQMLAGVCTGLAAYSEIRVDWVRTLFIFATLLTAGIFTVVYVALAFILPVAATREAYDRERA